MIQGLNSIVMVHFHKVLAQIFLHLERLLPVVHLEEIPQMILKFYLQMIVMHELFGRLGLEMYDFYHVDLLHQSLII